MVGNVDDFGKVDSIDGCVVCKFPFSSIEMGPDTCLGTEWMADVEGFFLDYVDLPFMRRGGESKDADILVEILPVLLHLGGE